MKLFKTIYHYYCNFIFDDIEFRKIVGHNGGIREGDELASEVGF